MSSLKVLVIGAGNIAHKFDDVEGDAVLTHIKAYKRHPEFELAAVCDGRLQEARAAAERWGIPRFASSLEELADVPADVISVCVPDAAHESSLRACLDRPTPPRLVFCEKPFAASAETGAAIVREYERRGVLLAVNYSRRWLQEIALLVRRAAAGEFGKILTVRFKYYKGFAHNGSHFLDLLQAFAQPSIQKGVILSSTDDYGESDLTVSAACVLDSPLGVCTLLCEGYDSRLMTPLEFEIVFEKASLTLIERDGTYLSEARLRENSAYPGFFEFSEVTTQKINGSEAMTNAIDAIARAALRAEALASTGATALETLRLRLGIFSLPHL